MKKLILVSVFAALTIGTSAALTACGTSGEPAPSETTTSVSGVIDADASAVSAESSAVSSEASSQAVSEVTSAAVFETEKPYASAEDFVSSKDGKALKKAMTKELGTRPIDIRLLAEGDSVVVEYQYQYQHHITDVGRKMLKKDFKAQAKLLKKSLKDAVKGETGLSYRVLNGDGSFVMEEAF